MGFRVCVVEDERDILETLCYTLQREGYESEGFPDGASALLAFRDRVPDLVIVDWMLPGMSGLDLCRILRGDQRFQRTGLLMLTARGTELDAVTALNVGADDYVTKPFRTRELLARVKALLRRTTQQEAGQALRRAAGVWLDTGTYRAGAGDLVFDLTPTEFKLLELLIRHPGRVYTRGQILSNLWPDDKAVEDRAVDVHIARLRDKMGSEGQSVETVRGVGYRFKGD
jgi:two-component system phosphate regulon response regulator PhoB